MHHCCALLYYNDITLTLLIYDVTRYIKSTTGNAEYDSSSEDIHQFSEFRQHRLTASDGFLCRLFNGEEAVGNSRGHGKNLFQIFSSIFCRKKFFCLDLVLSFFTIEGDRPGCNR